MFIDQEDVSSSSDGYLSDYYITGAGDPQDVRIYAENNSYTIDNNQYFEIPSISSTDTGYLSYGNFNFTFQNNYTTDYVLENTDALNAREFIYFKYDTSLSNITVHTGTNLDPLDLGDLDDGQSSTFIRFSSSGGIINFTIAADFTGTSFVRGSPPINLNFDRTYILGLINQFTLRSSSNTLLTIKMYDMSESTWKNVTEPILIKAGTTLMNYDVRTINENLDLINLADVNNIQFYYRNSTVGSYTVRVTELVDYATYGFDLPITNDDYVALEFDLKGKKTTVNGFYAFIRTLDVSLATHAELNITLYEATDTIVRTQTNLRANNISPNYSRMIDSFIVSNYNEDKLTYFKFNEANTLNLKLFNYFIVIKSNRSENVYSLTTIPMDTFGDPDNRVDHQLRITVNNGLSWDLARKTVPSAIPYLSERLDSSSFKLNVTRGYMPSDLWFSEDDNLNIQNMSIQNQVDNTGQYADSSYLTWGLGQWENNFTTHVSAVPPNDFQVDLNWNKTVIKGFIFNVTYSVKAYWIEPTTTSYNCTYDALPEWYLSFDLTISHTNINNWNFLEFWFVYPSSYVANNLTNPNNEDLFPSTAGESHEIFKLGYDKIIVNTTLINGIYGTYTLKAISPNLVYQMHSFNNYGGTFWETNGFMFGDDMTAGVDIQDINGNPPKGGSTNVTLFYPETPGGEYPGGSRIDATGVIKGSLLRYDFNNDTILQIRNTLGYFGNYYLGFFWTNGSAIGCKKLKLYIDSYNVDLDDFFYEPVLDKNILSGGVDKVFQSYSILIGTVNVSDRPNFYPVKYYDINQEYIFRVGGVKIPIRLKHFLQNETILNPDETVNLKVTLQNMFELNDVSVRIKAQLLSLVNNKWIIDEVTSSYKTLKLKGDPLGQDTQEFSLDLNIPHLFNDGIWQGVNAPVRKGGALTKLTIFIKYQNKDVNLGTYESSDYSLIVNSTQDNFEGYLLALKYDKQISGVSILKPFNLNECIYLPNQTTFVVNIYDKNYVSSYKDFIKSFPLKENSKFSNITINPESPIRGKKFNLSAIISTESGEPLPLKNVTLQYYDNAWENLSSQLSNNEGFVNFEIDTLILNEEDQLLFRLIWPGDPFRLSNYQNITVDLYRELNDLSISITKNTPQIYRNTKTTIKLTVTNNGTSSLHIPASNISFTTQPSLTNRIVQIDYFLLNRLDSGESTIIILEVDISSVKRITINVSLDAQNILTNEYVTFHYSITFRTYDPPLMDYFIPFITILMIAVFILFWLIMYSFIRRLIKRIETPIEEPTKKKLKRGKYVKISEIKGVPKEEVKTEKTDLDSLLEEKGLDDKKKKKS
ncbi:MAG: CARDB domain-containing protein [Candidatus Hodarchaeota archaeon]